MKKMSVKLKVTLWYTLIMVIMSGVVLAAMTSVSSDIVKRDIAVRVVRTVNDSSRILMGPERELKLPTKFRFYEQGVHMVLFSRNGEVVGGQLPFGIDADFGFEDDRLREVSWEGNNYCIYDKKIVSSDNYFWLRGVVSIKDESYSVNTVVKTNLLLALILIAVASLGGYFILNYAFKPVKKISETAKRISTSGNLSQRIGIGESKDEITELANTFDDMLEQLEDTFEKEKQFTSDASHELRTPVAVVLSECEYMLDCAKTPDEFKESAVSVKRQAERMSKLISELLTISRMDKNTLQVNFEEVDLSELLSFVCDEQEEIHSESPKMIRDIAPNIKARVDRFLLARLFINLISNAYQYGKDGKTILVSLKSEEKNIVFSVKDEGIGIAEEDIDKIWERFYQADSSRSDNNSMGLGLSMVKWIAECHNGNVRAESEYGRGSEFIFTMPK